ncbi:hypothetical protein C0Q88_12325 [Ralstonia pickettii]|uniref:Transmembrane protein n=1 Tax=Ralstonia pickettii TaxID=329 RepID=A0A2N4TSU0_RALPI|nr:hypothetical protein [Ralstonia pickettii]PLC42721.1 hypothetical protein C0Q88_12325 [Ralstonia pickettii]
MTLTNNVLLWSCAAFLFFGMWWVLYRVAREAIRQIRSRTLTWRESAPFALLLALSSGGCLSFLQWAVSGGRAGGGLGALLLSAAALLLASLMCPLREP